MSSGGGDSGPSATGTIEWRTQETLFEAIPFRLNGLIYSALYIDEEPINICLEQKSESSDSENAIDENSVIYFRRKKVVEARLQQWTDGSWRAADSPVQTREVWV